MDQQIKISLPKLGESILSATVVQWFKKIGDKVSLDEPLLEVSTDKVNSEIPAPSAGVLVEILAEVGQELQVGETLAVLSSGALAGVPSSKVPVAATQVVKETHQEDLLSPAVLRLLREKGIGLQEIERIPHTGAGGRLTKKDVEEYQNSPSSCAPCSSAFAVHGAASTASHLATTDRVKMTGLRKAIADNMVRSFYEAPHASLVTEIDVTAIMKKIREEKDAFLQKHGVKLTITPFAARAIARAVHAFPFINSSLDEDTIVMKRQVNLGIAVGVDQGVMVPVIRNSAALSILDLSHKITELAEKARTGTLSPDEVKEGTLTLTNFGMAGVQIGIPIIRYPEVAIVGLGAITKEVKPMADDSIAIRSIMRVSLTFDHRVLDGLYGCGFLKELKKHLEQDLTFD